MCPMSPRLLRPRAGGDPDAARYLSAVQAADGQPLEAAVRKAVVDFVIGCKADGIWQSLSACLPLIGARSLSGALTPLRGPTPTNNNFVSGDYSRKTGLLGNASTKFIETNYNNATDGQDDQHVCIYIATGAGSNQATMIGAGTSATTGSSGLGQLSNMVVRSRGSNSTLAALNNATGFFGISRSAAASYTARVNGANETVTATSQTPHNATFHVFKTSGSTVYSIAGIAFYSIGRAVNLTLLDARVSALYNAIGAAIP